MAKKKNLCVCAYVHACVRACMRLWYIYSHLKVVKLSTKSKHL
uniref:Uncharacterized protein n=1 Tax=Anguilla anguilla TaxID=7936 RepID=A0A0E9S0P8_ANGAN